MRITDEFRAIGTRLLAACTLAASLLAPAHAQSTLAQYWEFNDPAGTTLAGSAPGFEGGSLWSPNLAGVSTDGSGALLVGYNSTSVGYAYAPLNINEGGVFAATIKYNGWNIRNGAASGSARPIWNFGFRSAASTSSSLVADVQLTALATGIDVLVRDASTDFTAQRFTLPSVLPGALTMTLKLDKLSTTKTWTLSYSVVGGSSGSISGALGATAVGRAVSHVFLGVSGNHPNAGANANTPPAVDRVEVRYDELPVTILPPQGDRPGKPSNLTTYFNGASPFHSTNQPVGGPGLLLMGGGTEVDAAFTQRAYPVNNGGDIVVLRAAGADGYQAYLYTDLVNQLPVALRPTLQPNSVMTMVVDTVGKANSDYVFDAVSRANLVWLAGGDQSQYTSNWKGTRLAQAVKLAYQRGAVIGGTSAGMAASGEWIYDPGAQTAVISAEAVADPYRASIILSTDLFGLPLGFNILAEPHFANRDRMGRVLSFMARLRQDGLTSLVYGVALDECSAMFIDSGGLGTFQRQASPCTSTAVSANGYVLSENRRSTARVQVAPGQPLIYRNVQRSRFTASGQTFDFNRGVAGPGVPTSLISVEGAVPANAYVP